MKGKGISFKRLIKSFGYAFNGIRLMVIQEQNAKIHLIIIALVTIGGIILQIAVIEWIAIFIVSGGVLAAEAFNTSIETLSDTISPEYNKNIKQVKDFAAGAVLIMALTAVVTGAIIFLPKLLAFIQ
ncbi:MAG: diacylglycerol kinase family protein [Tannerella sp.]|jgi:diacylglycerol kinase (ATP)|nr:diacylglycerol kinase family protein [Tannerella sp.]